MSGLANVTLLAGHRVAAVRVGPDGRVTGVEAGADGGAGASGPGGAGGRLIEAAGVFGALDPVPNSEPFAPVAGPGPDGRIPVDVTHAVPGAPPGLFAAGDVRVGAPGRAVAAAGDGASAAAAIASFLHR